MPAPASEPLVYRRWRSLRDAEKVASDGSLRLIVSTDEPCSMGDWSEVLVHDGAVVDATAARSLLINHNPDQLAGPASGFAFERGECVCSAGILDGAKMQSGVAVRDAVASGALRGVSAGYFYERKDAVWNAETRTLTVNKWRLLEVSLTPIPADTGASVRSAPTISKEVPMPEVIDPTIALTARAEKAERALKLRSLADEHKIDATGVDFTAFPTVEAGLTDLLARKAKQSTDIPNQPITRVTADAGDKILAAATDSLYRTARITPLGDDAEFIKRHKPGQVSLRSLIARVAAHDGVRDSDLDVAAWASQNIDLRTFGRRDAPNKLTAGFSNILANVANKAVVQGMMDYNASTWQLWATQRNLPNFLACTNAGLSNGRLTKTPEGDAFPELNQVDGGYSSSLGLYGATVSLTFQALVNDQLGLFMQSLRRAGSYAMLTIDRRCYSVLLNSTWTNDLSTGAALTTIANLDKPRAALKNKLSPAGEKMGVIGRFLLHDTANALPAQQATGQIYAGGALTTPSIGSSQVRTVESHWIGDTALFSSAVTTDYYLTGDPSVIDTVLVNFLEGVGMAPIIAPYDPGAAAAEKWKIMVPFEATAATHVDSAANTRLTGMQKATVA